METTSTSSRGVTKKETDLSRQVLELSRHLEGLDYTAAILDSFSYPAPEADSKQCCQVNTY
jgi:hypothetical protein